MRFYIMFLQPKKTLYRKQKKGVLKSFEFKSNKLVFGDVGLKATQSGFITARQLEAVRRSVVRKLKRKGKLWFRIFPQTPLTRRPSESRMGKGKGSVAFWGVKVAKGQILIELCGIPHKTGYDALLAGSHKLPIQTRVCW